MDLVCSLLQNVPCGLFLASATADQVWPRVFSHEQKGVVCLSMVFENGVRHERRHTET